MIPRLPQFSQALALLAAAIFSLATTAQTAVFTDDFTTSAGTAFTTATGNIGTSPVWDFSRSGADFGARINGGNLTLTNDAGGAANMSGWGMAYANTSGFSSPYNPVLASSPGLVTWTFNMRQIRTNPRGFGSGNYGSAFIIAGSSGTSAVAGTGYAVILGNSGTTDPIRLVRYTAGLRTQTVLISSNTTGLVDFGNQYLSIKVTFSPTTGQWQLYVRNDGTAFADPATGTLTSQGTATSTTYTTSALGIIGAFWSGGISVSQTAFFDNVRVTVTEPIITSISPSSKMAGTAGFTLSVTGANFINGTSVVRWNGASKTTSYVSPTQLTATILASDIASAGTAQVTVANGAAISNSHPFTIDPAGVPALTVSATGLSPMTTVTGTASASQSYTFAGAYLTGAATVTAPANFEVSLNNSTFSNSVSLPMSNGSLGAQPIPIYVRVKSTAPSGVYSDAVANATSGAATKSVSVTATVLASQPTLQSSGITFSNVTSTSFTMNWTNGNGAKRLVLLRTGAAVNGAPVDGETYTASASFGAGSETTAGNFAVYSGSGNSVTVTGLSAATVYHAAIYEFNGVANTENYLITSPPIGNRTTLNAPVGWQIYATNATNIITFDSTVDGVNANAFQADGMSPNSESGELNSLAWAFAGFSDGAINFGGTYPEDSDYDRGPSTGGETEGGIYAFETSEENVSLGVQPTDADFTPGTMTLRFQNQTGVAVTSISIGYKVYVYNDEAGSASFNFSHSANTSTFTQMASMDVVSPAAADVSPGWKAYYRVATITGLNIANNNYYYLRWTGSAVSGSDNFDEFGLDDIVLVANPTTNFASFSGTAENFVVNGNTILSNDVTVNSNLTINSGKVDIAGKTLTLSGAVNNNIANGIKGSNASKLVISGTSNRSISLDMTTPGTTNALSGLSVETTNGNTVTMLTPLAVAGQLSVSASQILNLGTNALTGSLATIALQGTLATQNTTTLPFPTSKTWGGTINLNAATAAQTVVSGTYNNLTVSTTGGALMGGAATVNGTLTLGNANPSATVGALSTGAHILTMGPNGTNAGNGDVTGVITRNAIVPNVLYTFGHQHTSIIFPNSGTLPTSMSLKISIGSVPSWRPGAIARSYDFIQNGGNNTKAVIKAHYLDSELNGNLESKLVDWAYIIATNTTLEQGRSNFSTTENWIELTNINVGLYFAAVFDAVRLTLDESEAGSLTWNGSVSTSWTTAANWTPNATPSDATTVFIPNAATTPNDPMLNPIGLVGKLNIEPGGILNGGTAAELTVKGAGGAWINNGIFNPGTSTVIFSNADATIAGSTNFNNITVAAGATLRPISGNVMNISGTLTNSGTLLTSLIDNTIIFSGSNQTVPLTNGPLAAYHNLTVSGTGAVFPSALNISGNLTLNNAVDFSGKSISMTGTEPQIIGGSSAAAFGNLTISNTFGKVSLGTSTSVSGTLTLTSGQLDIQNHDLTLGANPVAGMFGGTNMIVTSGTGELRRIFSAPGSYVFPIGDVTGVAEYSPVTTTVSGSGFSNAYVGVSVADMIHPNNYSPSNHISRYWKIRQSGISNAAISAVATYKPTDVVGGESTIASAVLMGTFNQQSNPWVKHAPATAGTLSVANAALASGEQAIITGIKGGQISAQISGYGTFCKDYPVTLTATAIGGDAPYSYSWSNGLGSQQTALVPTSSVGTASYTVTIRDANGIAVSDTASVVVGAPTSAGTAGPNQDICPATIPNSITLTGNNGVILYWQSSTDEGFYDAVNIANVTNTLTPTEIGSINTTTWFRAVVQNGNCNEAYSQAAMVNVKSTTWNGTSWSNGVPDSATTAFVTGNLTATSDLNACSLTVSNDAVVVIGSGNDVSLTNALTVSSGSFILENNANLLQSADVANTGNIIVRRNSSALKRLDYTLWSAPVAGQNLLSFSPLTNLAPISRFYQYNTLTNVYNSVTTPATVDFSAAKGMLIRMPDNHPNTATVWNGAFTGVPNNGQITFNMVDEGMGKRFNLVGNPYPSPIDAVKFVQQNEANITGTLYFWRKTNNALSPSYCSWTAYCGFVGNGEAQVFDPISVIQTGQGFFVEGKGSGTELVFNNSQRIGNNAGQFFRIDEMERHRIWLNLTNATGAFSQTLVAYVEGATLGDDQNIDARYFNDGPVSLTTKIDGKPYAIQGRPLPFDASDVVPLVFKVTTAGTYNIAVDHPDGIFGEGQVVLLRDKLLGILHELNQPYAFTTDAGTFEERFEIVYQLPLSTGSGQGVGNGLTIYTKNGGFNFVASRDEMTSISIFDLRGRMIKEVRELASREAFVETPRAEQVLIAKVKFSDGSVETRKIK